MINVIQNLIQTFPLCVLLRHAEREEILPGTFGNDVNLTAQGRKTCLDWGNQFGSFVRKIYTSPVKRCVETANLIAKKTSIKTLNYSRLLGDPGVFVIDSNLTQHYFLTKTVYSIVQTLLLPGKNPEGFCAMTDAGIKELLHFMNKEAETGLNAFITHDSILAVVLGYFFPDYALKKLWPAYLEGMFFYRCDKNSLQLIYRNQSRVIAWC